MTTGERDKKAERTTTGTISFSRRVWVATAIVALTVLTIVVIWQAHRIILVLFAGGLLAVFLHSVSEWIHNQTPLPRRFVMFAALAAILISIGLVGWLTAPAIVDQAVQLGPALMNAFETIETRLDGLPLDQIGQDGPGGVIQQFLNMGSTILSRVTDVFSTTVGVLVNLVVILFVGLYFAYEPRLYRDGFLTLVPRHRRSHVQEILEEIYQSLRWWLVGRFAAMLILATLATIGLLLLDMPLALLLGVLVGIFEFIPYIGPALALVPALLIALGISTSQALYVLVLYLGLQVLESYILTPIIEQRVVSIAPVLLIGSQLILGTIFGFWGLLLAPALVVVARVIIKKLYVEEVLADHSVTYISEEHGNGQS